MEYPEGDSDYQKVSVDTSTAVNSLILDYYKKFGRKRDLEQFFSLSTAQSEIRDPTGTFWRNMKSQNDSSDSGEKKSESSTELCRISIKCSVAEPSSFQKKDIRDRLASDSDSPPIITEDVAPGPSQDSDVESVKSDDVQSQRSNDATLDTSMNKPHSPTSSVTSQRKLEWDSLADVGYANESDRKNSASSLSTLERLALKQQYSHNDSRQNIELGAPTSHSTPVEETETKSKGKKGLIKKTTKIYQKDVDLVELNVPHSSKTNLPQAISVNLSKHISFNVEKDGEVNIDNIKRNITVSPDKAVETDGPTEEKFDKEIQTSLIRNKDKSIGLSDAPSNTPLGIQKFPVLISLNTLKNRNRKKKLRIARQKLRRKSKGRSDQENILPERGTEQVSEAESFEYMPGHIYNQNHMKINDARDTHVDNKSNFTHAGNKSSLESSAGLTTDSSRGSTFAKDLERSVDLLKTILQQHNNDSTLKKKLIKEVVHRLIKSKYKDISSSTDFLSGLSVDSKLVGSEGNHTTTSTSDANTGEDTKSRKPKKSILRTEIFNSQGIASTSQSAPNLPSISNIEKPSTSKPVFFSNTDSEREIRESDKARTSSEELYKKYLEALRREEAYKKQIRNKENFLTQKVISSDTAVIQLTQADLKRQSKLKSLINDLTRNNYDDGSGDASKLEGHTNYNTDMHPYAFMNRQRSHSVFTLSSGNSNNKCKMTSSKNKNKSAIHDCKADFSKNQHHYCCCPYHTDHAKIGVTDSSVQVDIKCETPPQLKTKDECRQITCAKCKKESPCDIAHAGSHSDNVDLKYVCMCREGNKASYKVPEKFLIYKCSQLVNKSVQSDENQTRILSIQKDSDSCSCKQGGNVAMTVQQQCNCNVVGIKEDCIPKTIPLKQDSKSSQTNLNLNLMLHRKSSVRSVSSQSTEGTDFIKNIQSKRCNVVPNVAELEKNCSKELIHEAVRSIQTEISINPKLSDPGLSDINIIDDRDCVKVIGEHYKEKSKSNSETNTIDQEDKKACFISCDNKSVEIAEKPCSEKKEKNNIDNNCTEKLDKVAQSCLEPVENIDNKNFSDHFTIPIQGTNMTLKVNLATNDHDNVQPQNSTTKSQGVVTERMDVVEHFTSLRDDCTKSVQCCYPIVATPFQSTNDINVEGKNNKNDQQNDSPPDSSCCPVKAETNKKTKCNTFPKADHDNVRKPLLRTNTDPTNLEAVNLLQIDLQQHCKTTKCHKSCSVSKDEPNISNNNVKFKEITDQDKCIKFKAHEECSTSDKYSKPDDASKKEDFQTRNQCKLPASSSDSQSDLDTKKDNLLDLIRDITKRYSKKDIEKSKRKKCFKEIMSVLSYLLDTEDSTDEQNKSSPRTNTEPCQKQDDSLHKKAKNIGDNRSPKSCTGPCQKQENILRKRSPNISDDKSSPNSCSKPCQDQGVQRKSPNVINDKSPPDSCRGPCQDQAVQRKSPNVINDKSPPDSCRGPCQDQAVQRKSPNVINDKSPPDSCRGPCQDQGVQRKSPNVINDKSPPDSCRGPCQDQGVQRKSPNVINDKSPPDSCRGPCQEQAVQRKSPNNDDKSSPDSCTRSSPNSCSEKQGMPYKEDVQTISCCSKTFVDKGVQFCKQKPKSNKCRNTESSEMAVSTEFPTTSTDSATCKVLNKIKKECEKYHQKRCKSQNGFKPCETSSTTSVNCHQCKRIHHCHCMRLKCRGKAKTTEKPKKTCIAYNLILQTSDSAVSEDTLCGNNRVPLKSIIVKVPSKRRQVENVPFREMAAKLEKNIPCSPRQENRCFRSRSLPNESDISSTEDFLRKAQTYTVREYLERNRPDFVERCSNRQDCLKFVNETRPEMCPQYMKMVVVHTPQCVTNTCLEPRNANCGGVPMPCKCNRCTQSFFHLQNEVRRIGESCGRATERNAKRKLLSLQLDRQKALSAMTDEELRYFAKQLSEDLRRKKIAPKFINEREMKKHSEKIYKSLPEVTRKKEELKKENVKKTNLLMANIFKKNLQKKALRGSVNLSNYSTVIKI